MWNDYGYDCHNLFEPMFLQLIIIHCYKAKAQFGNFEFQIASFDHLKDRLQMFMQQYNESIRGAGMDLVCF